MEFRSITPHLGAEVTGIDLAEPMGSNTFNALREGWLKWGVLVFRDQDLSRDQHVALGSKFGELHVHPMYKDQKEHPEILKVATNADDLPYWCKDFESPHLVVPYTLDVNDMRFAAPQGFNAGDQFLNYLTDTFDELYAEGAETPKMMSVGLHCRIVGKPGRAAALRKFLTYISDKPDVWVCRRIDIARHWHAHHAPT